MNIDFKNFKPNIKAWRKIAFVSAMFSFVICMLLIVNYLQSKSYDPVQTELINTLVEKLVENPKDTQLREQIRTLDLIARKAYFTNQWQVRTGGYFLIFSVALLILSLQIIKSNSMKDTDITEDSKFDVFLSQKKTQKWASIGGGVIVVTALIFAFLTHNDLGGMYANANNQGQNDSIDSLSEKNLEIVSNESTSEEIISETDTSVTEENLSDSIQENKDTIPEVLSEYPTNKEIHENFPTFRGPGGNGISYLKNVPASWNGSTGKNILWKVPVPIKGYNSPVVWGDKVFISGANATKRQVYCYDRHTGKLLWTGNVNNVSGSPGASPKVTDDTGHAAPTMATDGRRVYAIFANGDIISFDMEGKRLWARNLGVPSNHYGHSSSLMLFRNMLIVQFDHKKSAKVMALSTKTGNTVWSTSRKVKVSWASPVVAFTGKQTEILLAAEPFVASYNPYSGKENWKLDCIFGEVGASVAYADGVVFALNEYATLTAIKLGEKPEMLWEDDEYLSDAPSPIATKKYLFVVTSYGVVVCYDAKTGKKYWEKDFGDTTYSSPIMVGGRIYLLDSKGIMHVFSASDKYVSISNSPLGEGSVYTTPAFAEGRVYIRTDKNLYCIGKK